MTLESLVRELSLGIEELAKARAREMVNFMMGAMEAPPKVGFPKGKKKTWTKHPDAVRVRAVSLADKIGSKETAARLGLSRKTVEFWRAHPDGKKKVVPASASKALKKGKRRHFTTEFKAQLLAEARPLSRPDLTALLAKNRVGKNLYYAWRREAASA